MSSALGLLRQIFYRPWMLATLAALASAALLLSASIGIALQQLKQSETEQMNAQGELFADGKATDLEALKALLRQQAERNPQTEVQLSIDQSLPYARAVELMDAAQSAGLTRMGFVAQPAVRKR